MPRMERVRELIGRSFPREQAGSAVAAVEPFVGDLQRYTEVAISPTEVSIGFVTRGEDAGLTVRVARLLGALDLPPEAVAHQQSLATWFDHKRAFLKVEWTRDGAGVMAPRVSCYFRRRPQVDVAVEKLGLAPALRNEVREIAYLLGKTSIHFVAAAFTPGGGIDHKLYFSQYAKPEQRRQLEVQIDALMGRLGIAAAARDRWRGMHETMLGRGSPTFFASIGIGAGGLSPTLKLDYAGVAPGRASDWVDGDARIAATLLGTRMCAVAGIRELSYVGIRFSREESVRLKYYVVLS